MPTALNVVMPTSRTHAFIFFISREPSLWLSIAFPTKKDRLSNGSVPLMTVSVCFLLIIIRRLCRVCSSPGQRMSVFLASSTVIWTDILTEPFRHSFCCRLMKGLLAMFKSLSESFTTIYFHPYEFNLYS